MRGQNAIKLAIKKNLLTLNKHQEERVTSSGVDCFCLNGPACEIQRLGAQKSSTGPLKQQAAVSLSVQAHHKVGNSCTGEGGNTEDVLLEVQCAVEGEGTSIPNKNLCNEVKHKLSL